jgi:hypothetical protein
MKLVKRKLAGLAILSFVLLADAGAYTESDRVPGQPWLLLAC